MKARDTDDGQRRIREELARYRVWCLAHGLGWDGEQEESSGMVDEDLD